MYGDFLVICLLLISNVHWVHSYINCSPFKFVEIALQCRVWWIFLDVQRALEMNLYYIVFAFIVLNMSIMSGLFICCHLICPYWDFFFAYLFYKFWERCIKISHYEYNFVCFSFSSVHFWCLHFEVMSVNVHKFIFIFYWWIETFITMKWPPLSPFVYLFDII